LLRPRRGIAKGVYGFLLQPEASVIVVSVALVAYFKLANANFLTNDNLQTVSQFVAAPVIIACGEIMLLICREIDLSVGQTFALSPFTMGHAHAVGLPVVAAIVVALAVCALIGLAIGLITIGLMVPSFITTLGMLFLMRGGGPA
jgi:simple sugar transport system permease protein